MQRQIRIEFYSISLWLCHVAAPERQIFILRNFFPSSIICFRWIVDWFIQNPNTNNQFDINNLCTNIYGKWTSITRRCIVSIRFRNNFSIFGDTLNFLMWFFRCWNSLHPNSCGDDSSAGNFGIPIIQSTFILHVHESIDQATKWTQKKKKKLITRTHFSIDGLSSQLESFFTAIPCYELTVIL